MSDTIILGQKTTIPEEKEKGGFTLNANNWLIQDDLIELIDNDPDIPEDYKPQLTAGYILSQEYDIPLEDAVNNAEQYLNELYGEEETIQRKSHYLKEKWQLGRIITTLGKLRWQQLVGNDSPDIEEAIQYWKRQMPSPDRIKQAIPKRILGEVLEQLPLWLEGMKQSLPVAASEALLWAAVSSLASGGLGTVATPITGATGFAVGMQTGMVYHITQMEAGLAYDELLDIRGPNGEQIDPAIAKPVALAVGVINGLLEIGQVNTLLKAFGGKRVAKTGIKLISSQIANNPRIREILFKNAARYAGHLTEEVAQEIMQETTNIVFDEFAKYINNHLKGTHLQKAWDEALPRLKEIAIKSALGFSGMLFPGAAKEFTAEVVETKLNEIANNVFKVAEEAEEPKVISEIEVIDTGGKTIKEKITKQAVTEEPKKNKIKLNEAELEKGDTVYIDGKKYKMVLRTKMQTILEEEKSRQKLVIPAFDEIEVDRHIPVNEGKITDEDLEGYRIVGDNIIVGLQEVQGIAASLWRQDLESSSQKSMSSFIERFEEAVNNFGGRIYLDEYLEKSEEYKQLPRWVKRRYFSKDRRFSTLDEIAEEMGVSDSEILFTLKDWRLNKLPESTELLQEKLDKGPTESDIRSYIPQAEAWFESLAASKGKKVVFTYEDSKHLEDLSYQDLKFLAKEDIKNGEKAFYWLRKSFMLGKKKEAQKWLKKISEIRKRQIILNDIKKETNRIINQLKRVKQRLKNIDSPYREQLQIVFDNMDFSKLSSKKRMRLEKTREFLEKNPEVELPERVLKELERLDRKSVREITIQDLRMVRDMIMHMYKLGARKREIRIGRKVRQFKEVKKQALAEMKPPEKIREKIVEINPTRATKIKNFWKLIKLTLGIRSEHYDLIIESLAGINSMMYKVFYDNIKEGTKVEAKTRLYLVDLFRKALKESGFSIPQKKIDAWLEEKVEIRSKDRVIKIPRNYKLALYRHLLNEDNKKALMTGGFGFVNYDNPDYVFAPLTEDDVEAIMNSMDKDELAFAGNPVTLLFDETYNLLDKVFYEVNGYHLPKAEGLYYPKNVMPVARGTDFEKEQGWEQFKEGLYIRVGMEKGRLNPRVGSKAPIYINGLTYDINQQINWVSAYHGLEIPLREASKLLYDKEFASEFRRKYGKEVYYEIEKGLKDIAGQWKDFTTTEKILLKAKDKISAVTLFNPRVWLYQTLSFILGVVYIKPKYMLLGSVDSIIHAKQLHERHKYYSPEYDMRARGYFSRDIAEVFMRSSEKQVYGGKKGMKEALFEPIRFFDITTVRTIYQAAVLQVLDEFKAGHLSREVRIALNLTDEDIQNIEAEEKMQLAYKFAEYVVERTQPMFNPEHRSSLSRGTPLEKLMTMYSSFTNQAYNIIVRTWREAAREGTKQAYAKFFRAVGGVAFSAIIGPALIRKLFDIIKKRERDLKWYILDNIGTLVYFFRGLIPAVVSYVEKGKLFAYDVTIPVANVSRYIVNFFGSALTMMTTKSKKKKENEMKTFLYSLGVLLSYGLSLPYIPIRDLSEIIIKNKEGKSKGTGAKPWL